MVEYNSCHYIQQGLNFFANNTIKVCCFTLDADVDICKTDESIELIIRKIIDKKMQMIKDFSKGNIYDCCRNCVCLEKRQWGQDVKQIVQITLNHYMTCNLRCVHCGYVKRKETDELFDTDHEEVLYIIKKLVEGNVMTKNIYFDVGGGEPSLSKGLLKIIQFCIENKYKMHINSNGANYVETIAQGINERLIDLTLTPDAGSKDVYTSIKGADYFDEVWGSIEKYMTSCNTGVRVKFILQKGNIQDVVNMVDMCVNTKVREVILDLDLNIRKVEQVDYMDYINEFRTSCKMKSIRVHKGSFVPDELWL